MLLPLLLHMTVRTATSLIMLLLTLLMLYGQRASAQPLDNPCKSKSAQKFYEKARDMRNSAPWDKTYKQYRKALEDCPEWIMLYPEIAIFFQDKGRYENAIEILNEAGEALWSERPDWLFRTGNLEFENGQFAAAEKHLTAYLATDHDNDQFRRLAKENLAHAKYTQYALANPQDVDLIPLPPTINSDAAEYLPVLTADENLMVFTRRIAGREEIYFSTKDQNGQWTEAQPMDLGNQAYRKGGFHISPDGKLIVFAMADHPQCVGGFDLFYLERREDEWIGPFNLGQNINTPDWESQPCIGPDSRTLYFSSGRKGGEGQKDIWYTRRIGPREWMDPINLGPVINTRHNESTPYLHRDGESFYFRSEGHPGLGSFDIFYSRLTLDSGFTEPVNLGYPINGSGNEGGLFVSMNGIDAYYATSSPDNQQETIKDIYTFRLPQNVRAKPATYILATVLDRQTGAPVKASISLTDFEKQQVVFNATTDHTGSFLSCIAKGSAYALQATADGYLLQSERFELRDEFTSDEPFEVVLFLEPIPSYVAADTISKPVVLKNILFEFGTDNFLPGSYSELNALVNQLKNRPEGKIRIYGHTDDIGEETDNMQLSRDRAEAVYEYLVDQGIETDRLSFKGFGETRPVASNDTEAGRRQNRRVEFIYISP
jgi:outer membrane protein OmpA-like peptidoglycan-associated protein